MSGRLVLDGQAQATGAGWCPGPRLVGGVLVELGLDVVLRGTADVEIRGVVGVADPAEVSCVGFARGGVGGLELGQQRVGRRLGGTRLGAGGPRTGRGRLLVLDGAAVVEQLVHDGTGFAAGDQSAAVMTSVRDHALASRRRSSRCHGRPCSRRCRA